MLFGGIEDIQTGKIQANGDIHILSIRKEEAKWYKEQINGDERPVARSQHIALWSKEATQNKVFVFGGHHDAKTRLNDSWYYDRSTQEWERIHDEKDNLTNQESTVGAPHPRANMGACIYDGKVWIFGGHGGLQYQRTSFNDLFAFDLATNNWEKINYNNAAPDGRGGHSLFAYNNKLYVYGGWNAEMQFNNVVEFDLDKREWQDNDCINDIHRWNHSSVLVEAIPTWKFFIFGGEEAEFMEGNDRQFGKFVNSSCFLDLGTMKWT